MGNITIEVPPQNAAGLPDCEKSTRQQRAGQFFFQLGRGSGLVQAQSLCAGGGGEPLRSTQLNLKYAHKDAQDFVRAIKAQEGGLYRKVNVRLLDQHERSQRCHPGEDPGRAGVVEERDHQPGCGHGFLVGPWHHRCQGELQFPAPRRRYFTALPNLHRQERLSEVFERHTRENRFFLRQLPLW